MKRNKEVHDGMPVVKIFWTGGWDSSFRILMLSEKSVVIQPYYLCDNRDSEQKELEAIDAIKSSLLELETTRCIFLPLKKLQTDVVEQDAKITASYERLKSIMGSQYDWLACFAKEHKGVELCIHKDDRAFDAIKKFGSVNYVEDGTLGGYYVLNRKNSSEDMINLFGNLRFPLLKETKVCMKQRANKMGCSKIMDKTWFCYMPKNGKPCGVCNPCKYSIEEGMGYRFSFDALIRYNWRKSRIRKFLSKIKWMIFKKPQAST